MLRDLWINVEVESDVTQCCPRPLTEKPSLSVSPLSPFLPLPSAHELCDVLDLPSAWLSSMAVVPLPVHWDLSSLDVASVISWKSQHIHLFGRAFANTATRLCPERGEGRTSDAPPPRVLQNVNELPGSPQPKPTTATALPVSVSCSTRHVVAAVHDAVRKTPTPCQPCAAVKPQPPQLRARALAWCR